MTVTTLTRRSALTAVLPFAAPMARSARPPDYLSAVRRSVDTLLGKGMDVYGPRRTALWAGVMDTRTFTVPPDGVPAPRGVRENDRAVGGANLYHEVVTLRVMRALSGITGDPAYQRAARDYMADFLRLTQNPVTGFLGWGEHLYYDFFRDEVAASRRSHELLEWTPPWEELWEVEPNATRKAIAAIRYHFYTDDPAGLFNRHAWWDRAEHQKPGGQPWIKHSGLFAYSFLFLYHKTRDPQWREWGLGPAALYWNHRNPETGLTLGCIGDPRPATQQASAQMPELAYWLLKASRWLPEDNAVRQRARTLLDAWHRWFSDEPRDAFRTDVALDGRVLSDGTATVWDVAYGNPGILPTGRIAAYFARLEREPRYAGIAKRVARIARRTPLPEGVSLEGVAFALNLSLDLYDLSPDREWREDARRYADLALRNFWRTSPSGALFVRQQDDPYYEAKVGVGDLLAGLLRLHAKLHPNARMPLDIDWSF